jgi:hypothetical protein
MLPEILRTKREKNLREREISTLVGMGTSSKDVAGMLHINRECLQPMSNCHIF